MAPSHPDLHLPTPSRQKKPAGDPREAGFLQGTPIGAAGWGVCGLRVSERNLSVTLTRGQGADQRSDTAKRSSYSSARSMREMTTEASCHYVFTLGPKIIK